MTHVFTYSSLILTNGGASSSMVAKICGEVLLQLQMNISTKLYSGSVTGKVSIIMVSVQSV